MTNKEAIRRILDHKRVHSLNESRAVLINEALDLAIKALEQTEVKGDLISRSVVKSMISDKSISIKFEEEKRGNWQNSLGMILSDIYNVIDNAPTVVLPVARWDCYCEGQKVGYEKALSEQPQGEWIPVSERLPNHYEYIKNNGLFNVSDGNRSYSEWFDIYDKQGFGEPTMAGFCVDYAVTAWQPLPEPYKKGGKE